MQSSIDNKAPRELPMSNRIDMERVRYSFYKS